MKKLCIILLLAFALVFSLSSVAYAKIIDSGTCGADGDDLTWTLDDKGLLTISGTGKMANYKSYRSVPWHSNTSSIEYLIIDHGVTSIGNSAFSGCDNLTDVTIPDSVTSIGECAFCDCESLTNVTIPDSVTSIGDEAFCDCESLISVTIPASVTSIGDEAFWSCSKLTEINVDSDNNHYCSQNGVLFSKDQTILICCPERKSGEYAIPESVESIADYAFDGCISLTRVTIPDSVTSIGNNAFYACTSLTSVTIPDSVISIGAGAFCNCIGLTEAKIGSGVTIIGDIAFWSCIYLTTITIPASVESIGESAFEHCIRLTDINVDIENRHYYSQNGVVFSKDQTILICCPAGKNGEYAIPESVESIGDDAFRTCVGLTAITIPDTVTSIGETAFINCWSLTEITIPTSVESIGNGAFAECYDLNKIIIPNSVKVIGSRAFEETAYYKDETNWDNDVLYIDNALIEARNSISGDYTVKNGTTIIADSAFRDCQFLTGVTCTDSVTSIGYRAFDGCSNLTSVTLPNITNINNYTFYNCNSLTEVNIGIGVASIGGFAFDNCSSLMRINVDSNNTVYSSHEGVLFNKDKTELILCPNGLSEIMIPASVTSIGEGAFYFCDSLTGINVDSNNTVYSSHEGVLFNKDKTTVILCPYGKSGSYVIPAGVTSIGDYAFCGCDNLTNITIPKSVTTICESAFEFCSSLISITIPDSVTNIGIFAFNACNELTDVYYNGTKAEWNSIVLGNYNDDLLNANIHFLEVIEDNGIQVKVAPGVLESGIKFKADELEDASVPKAAPEGSVVYDLYFEQSGERVQPNSEVTVFIPVPEDMDGEKCKVYYIDDKDSLTDMNAIYDGRYLVFTTDHFSYYAVVEEGFPITLDDYTNGLATITGIENGGSFSGETSFSVSCDDACAVLCSTDGENYTRLTGTAEYNGYSFTVDVNQEMTIVVALKGDVNLDGILKNQDVTMAKAANLGKRTLSTLQEMVADVTGDGVFKNQDITKFKAALLGKTTLNWDM